MNTNSNVYTIAYATIMVVIVAVLLAFVSQALTPRQQANIKLDQQKQMLVALNQELDSFANPAARYEELVRDTIQMNEDSTKANIIRFEVEGATKYVLRLHGAGRFVRRIAEQHRQRLGRTAVRAGHVRGQHDRLGVEPHGGAVGGHPHHAAGHKGRLMEFVSQIRVNLRKRPLPGPDRIRAVDSLRRGQGPDHAGNGERRIPFRGKRRGRLRPEKAPFTNSEPFRTKLVPLCEQFPSIDCDPAPSLTSESALFPPSRSEPLNDGFPPTDSVSTASFVEAG